MIGVGEGGSLCVTAETHVLRCHDGNIWVMMGTLLESYEVPIRVSCQLKIFRT